MTTYPEPLPAPDVPPTPDPAAVPDTRPPGGDPAAVPDIPPTPPQDHPGSRSSHA